MHKKGGALYVAKACSKHDSKLSWNTVGPIGPKGATGNTGPQGPGATSVVFNKTGSASPTPATIGHLGPYTLTGVCTASGGNASFQVFISGPSLTADGIVVDGSTTYPVSETSPVPISNYELAHAGPTSSQAVGSAELFVSPNGGAPFQTLLTDSAVGGSPPAGQTANTCHGSPTMIPVAAPAGG